MFEKFLYVSSALLSLSCSSYAMEGKGKDEDVPDLTTLATPPLYSKAHDQKDEEVAGESSTVISLPEPLFSNDEENVKFTMETLRQALKREEPRAINLHKLLLMGHLVANMKEIGAPSFWEVNNIWRYSTTCIGHPVDDPVYELPLLSKELDEAPRELLYQLKDFFTNFIADNLLSNDHDKITFTVPSLLEAVERKEPRAMYLYMFLEKKFSMKTLNKAKEGFERGLGKIPKRMQDFYHLRKGIEEGKTRGQLAEIEYIGHSYELPFLAETLDNVEQWISDKNFRRELYKIDIALGVLPTTKESSKILLNIADRSFSWKYDGFDSKDKKKRKSALRWLALQTYGVPKIISDLQAENAALKAELEKVRVKPETNKSQASSSLSTY